MCADDILAHVNELNVKLQCKDQFLHEIYLNVKAFMRGNAKEDAGVIWLYLCLRTDVQCIVQSPVY